MNVDPSVLTHVLVLHTIKDVFLAGLLGFLVVIVNSMYKNYWLRQKNTMIVGWILPAIALIITKVIATNFALSLGMIGALSIIRYRTPVKSNFELALLFGLVTIGIAVGVTPELAILLAAFMCLIPLVVLLLYKGLPSFFLSLPYTSEGKIECVLQGPYAIFKNIKFPHGVFKSVDVHSSSEVNQKMFSSISIFSTMDQAKTFISEIEKDHEITAYSLREF